MRECISCAVPSCSWARVLELRRSWGVPGHWHEDEGGSECIYLEQKHGRVGGHDGDRVLSVSLMGYETRFFIAQKERTSMLIDGKSLDTIRRPSSALVQHADSACRLGLALLDCCSRFNQRLAEENVWGRTGDKEAWIPKLFRNSRTCRRNRLRKEK